jgi:hypothetical protein
METRDQGKEDALLTDATKEVSSLPSDLRLDAELRDDLDTLGLPRRQPKKAQG